MRALSRSYSAPRDGGASEERPLLFRNVALLYPWKDVLERIRRDSNDDAPLPKFIAPMFDEDGERPSPLAVDDEIRVIIAQDDAGVSLERLLFDSKIVHDGGGNEHNSPKSASNTSRHSPQLSSLGRSAAQTRDTPSSGFLRHQQTPIDTQHRSKPPQVRSDSVSAPSTPARVISQAGLFRRMPAYISLADARNDPQLPIENSKEEMDSWLDCVFGKSQMRYKGENTKLHVLDRRPSDSKRVQKEGEMQRDGLGSRSERDTPSPKSKSEDPIEPRKSALLISRTFTVPIEHEDLPEQLRRGSDTSRPKTIPSRHCSTPTYGVAVLLPLSKPIDGEESALDHAQLAIDKWHVIVRALDALEASAALHIRQEVTEQSGLLARRYSKALPSSARTLKLKPGALQENESVEQQAECASMRIARAFSIVHVAARNEWNIWRDELRDTSRSGKGSDTARTTFLQVALTAALSSSLSWMRMFAPPHLQTRIEQEARKREHSYDEPQNRIVVMTTDHNQARQIIYILSKFIPAAQLSTQFARTPARVRPTAQVSALTQGLKAVNLKPETPSVVHHPVPAPAAALDAPLFNLPKRASSGTSPAKHSRPIGTLKVRSPSSGSTQRCIGRLDVQGKCTPAMPIASAPGSSYTTPAASPEARPGSSASAQGDLLRHLQRNNSALSETSTESGSFWNSLRSTSWNWGLRRESGATNTSGSEVGTAMSASIRGDALPSILKTGKTSLGRNSNKKLVRMVEEAEELRLPHGESLVHRHVNIPTSTTKSASNDATPPAASPRILEYSYDAAQSVVDVQLLGAIPSTNSYTIPASKDSFPVVRKADNLTSEASFSPSTNANAAYDRVAGYLERLHPDFALQAVSPYPNLMADIKQSMRGERSPKQVFSMTDSSQFPIERWVEVCSTVILDTETLAVKRVTLRRHVRYTLLSTDPSPHAVGDETYRSSIKITKSDEMDTVKRTYRRNDAGNKVDWKDKKIVSSDYGSSNGSGENSMTSSYDQFEVGSSGSTIRRKSASVSEIGTSQMAVGTPRPDHSNSHHLPTKSKQPSGPIGDDLTAFIDEAAKNNNKPKARPATATPLATRRVARRNSEGKITGWKEVDDNEPDEPGVHDLPVGFVNHSRTKLMPAIHERTLEEAFDEETLSKADPSIVTLLEQVLANTDPRSGAPSRASSTHERTHSRSNSGSHSICGSGLTELQVESKKIVKDVLEGLVMSVASDKESATRPSGRFFPFRRGGQGSSETSILRQSISKWLAE